jgi:hypothetical protein
MTRIPPMGNVCFLVEYALLIFCLQSSAVAAQTCVQPPADKAWGRHYRAQDPHLPHSDPQKSTGHPGWEDMQYRGMLSELFCTGWLELLTRRPLGPLVCGLVRLTAGVILIWSGLVFSVLDGGRGRPEEEQDPM